MDVWYVDTFQDMVLVIVCIASSFVVASRLFTRTGISVWRTFERIWLNVHGMPECLDLDNDTGFTITVRKLREAGVLVRHTAPYTPWMVAINDRSHRTLRYMVSITLNSLSLGPEHWHRVYRYCVRVYNLQVKTSIGASPFQLSPENV